MNFLYVVFAAIVVLGPLIALHEYGHFWVARKFGVKVLTFSIGFGPVVFRRIGKDGVDYRISLIPLGGYVRMLDEREGSVEKSEQHKAFNRLHPLKKIAVVAAGPIMNFIIAILLFWVLFIPSSEQLNTKLGKIIANSPASEAGLLVGDEVISVDNKPTDNWQKINMAFVGAMGETRKIPITVIRNNQQMKTEIAVKSFIANENTDVFDEVGLYPFRPHVAAKIGTIQKDSAAFHQGLQVNDKVISVNNIKVNDWFDMGEIIQENPEKLLQFTVKRGTDIIQLSVMPQGKEVSGKYRGVVGISPVQQQIKIPSEYKKLVDYSVFEALQQSLIKTYELSVLTINGIGKMIGGLIGLDNISGPITIAKMAGDTMNIGWQALLSYMALISVSLAVLNLLPIPILDGGHILYYTYELIVGKPIPESIQGAGLKLGLFIMLFMMIVAITNDISRLF